MRIDAAMLSRPGGRQYNEDACGFLPVGKQWCFVVSDGAGGHGGGSTASRKAVESIVDGFSADPGATPERIHALIEGANHAVVDGQQSAPGLEDMRATLVLLCVDANARIACWGNVGDSRLYLFRRNQLTYQSRDHSLVQSLVDAGLVKPHEMRTYPNRSVLTSALGSDEMEVNESVEPYRVGPGDSFLLCSDGFWEYVDEELMQTALGERSDAEGWLAALEPRLLEAARKGHDNYSAIAVRIFDAEPVRDAAQPPLDADPAAPELPP